MAQHNKEGRREWWNRFESRGVAGFLGSIIEAMQNWQDNTQMRMPGYRDRVAHVGLGPDEGGLNLAMPPERIAALSGRGRKAGETLAARFTPGSAEKLNWENHRWVRFRSTLSTLEDLFGKLARKLDPAAPPFQEGDVPYAELVSKKDAVSYDWERNGQRERAEKALAELREISMAWAASEQRMSEGAPQPTPELRARPKI